MAEKLYTLEEIEKMHEKYLSARWWFMANILEQFAATVRENINLKQQHEYSDNGITERE